MSDTKDIEKKSLEAHVELCAERYKMLELKLETVEEKMSDLEVLIKEVMVGVQTLTEKRHNQLLGWATAIIASLVGAVAWFASHWFKNP